MIQTMSDGGWMGIAPSGKRITLRSLDFWRLENGLIRENWVLVDLLDVYDQIGVDVFARIREFNKVRRGFDPETGVCTEIVKLKMKKLSKSKIIDFYHFYDELEAANADSVGKVISQFTNPDFQWYGVYPFSKQNGGDAVAKVFLDPFSLCLV